MSDIQKVREVRSKDDGDWDEWPYPTETIESKVSGLLRQRIFTTLGRVDDGSEVLLVEDKVSGGYSEYTQEDNCEIEVKIGGARAWHSHLESSTESAMAAFLKHFGG